MVSLYSLTAMAVCHTAFPGQTEQLETTRGLSFAGDYFYT